MFSGWKRPALHRQELHPTHLLTGSAEGLSGGLGPAWSDTVVVVSTEFGRTARINGTGGTDHGTSAPQFIMGGGVKGGHIYGATDEFGFKAVEDPVHIHDLHATILHILGLDHEKLTHRYAGRDFRLTDVHGKVVKDLIA